MGSPVRRVLNTDNNGDEEPASLQLFQEILKEWEDGKAGSDFDPTELLHRLSTRASVVARTKIRCKRSFQRGNYSFKYMSVNSNIRLGTTPNSCGLCSTSIWCCLVFPRLRRC